MAPLQSAATPFKLSKDLLGYAVTSCDLNSLGRTVSLLSCSDLVLAVHERMEVPNGSFAVKVKGVKSGKLDENDDPNVNANAVHSKESALTTSCEKKGSVQASDNIISNQSNAPLGHFKVSQTDFIKDGILMSSTVVLGPLLRHAAKEFSRRCRAATQHPSENTESTLGAEIDDLVQLLQRSENHMLAGRVLLGSWGSKTTKSQLLRTSLLSLGRKILCYKDIDVGFAVACLSAVPYETMVRELKAAVPSIQSDFSRLRTVALVGEQLAHMWGQEELLLVFQSLQNNAKWWHTLTGYGVPIDPKAFQSSVPAQRQECIRSVVPELLEHSQMNLELAVEYCEHFDLDTTFAIICYVEKVLLSLPTYPLDSRWKQSVRRAASRVSENDTLKCLRSTLTRVHPLDYEKISYVCEWLCDLLADEESVSSKNTDNSDKSIDKSQIDIPSNSIDCSVSNDSLVTEIHSYHRYHEIAQFLSDIHIPTEATRDIPHTSAQGPSIYEGLYSAYQSRLPLWQLLENPWQVISPVLATSPEVSLRLSPLCSVLRLERDELYAKRAMALYAREESESPGNEESSKNNKYSTSKFTSELHGDNGIKRSFDALQESVQLIQSATRRVEVWRWVYEKERRKNETVALRALEMALECNAAAPRPGPSGVRDELLQEVIKMKCETAVRTIVRAKDVLEGSNESQTIVSIPTHLQQVIHSPNALLTNIFEYALETAWDFQLAHLLTLYDSLSIYDVMEHPIGHSARTYLSTVGTALNDISSCISFLPAPICKEESVDPLSSVTKSSNSLDNMRQSLVYKLLSDVDLSSAVNNVSLPTTQSVTLGSTKWKDDSGVLPTPAEYRRKEDIHTAFCVAAIICTCTSESAR